MTLKMPNWLLTSLHSHVKGQHPNEACGAVLRGTNGRGRVYHHARMSNVSTTPRTEYAWDPQEHQRLYDHMDECDLGLWVVYHSHPETAPEPSEVDKAAAWYPGVHYLIFSTAGGKEDVWYNSYRCVEPGVLAKEEVEVL